MARIRKADHSTILHMVDVEQRKVSEVAAEYGCTPANIYALLGKLRRMGDQGAISETVLPTNHAPDESESAAGPASGASDLFAAATCGDPTPTTNKPQDRTVAEPILAPPVKPPAAPRLATVVDLPRRGSLTKQGFGLAMRTAEGEENVSPFRSLDDLLSAVKPILRAAARSPDTVWFSIQAIDLSAFGSDAA